MSGSGLGATGDVGGDRGLGEVHSGLHAGATGGTSDSYGAIAYGGTATEQQGMKEKVTSRLQDLGSTVKDRAQGMMENRQELAGQARERAGQAASMAREKMGDALGRAESLLEERGMLERVRGNALPALGIAFAVGYLLAGSDNAPKRGPLYKAKNQLKGAVVGGLSAAIAQEARNLIGFGQQMAAQAQAEQGGQSGGPTHREPSHREFA